jgi:hypothetical protein
MLFFFFLHSLSDGKRFTREYSTIFKVCNSPLTMSVSLLPMQAIFQRYPRPEKECQSFSLISHDRSLDIICKDKDEAEVWFAGLKTLITRSHQRKWRTESRSDMLSSGTTSPRTYTRRSSPLSSPFSSNDSVHKVFPTTHPAHPTMPLYCVFVTYTELPNLFLFCMFHLFSFPFFGFGLLL